MYRREEETLIKAAMCARLPWLSPDAEPEYIFQTDPPELIEKCCHCTRSDCVDCIAGMKYSQCGRPKNSNKVSLSDFTELLTRGLNREQVCSLLGIGRATFYNYKNQLLKGAMA